MRRVGPLSLLAPFALSCVGPTAALPGDDALREVPLSTLAVRSAAVRDDNRAGLVTRATFERWVEAWGSTRPEGITGDLVVLQADEAPAPGRFVAQTPGVRAYHAADLAMLLQSRNNGVVALSRVPGNGVRADAYLRRYGVRADRDLVVFVAGTRSARTVAELARAWLTLRYWGLDHRSLALVDAPVAELPARLRADTAPPPPIANDDVRVPALRRSHFALLAHLGDVRSAVGAREPLLDVRPAAEFEGRAPGSSALDETCLASPAACTPTFSGRIAGARHLPLERLLDPDTEAFRPLDALDAALAPAGPTPPILYDTDGSTSAIAAFAALAVVGTPARWYAASFREWGALNASHPVPALQTLPPTSPWRTDEASATEGERRWGSAELAVRPLVFDPLAPNADRIRRDDLEYLASPAPLPAPGAGDSGCLR
ncbi:MAG: hypothetical protein INH37_16760 [Myxococcaceae bacterium]|nr:hypothetical protein [Myxococcaceae bacterium]